MIRRIVALSLFGLALTLLCTHFVLQAVHARETARRAESVARQALLSNGGHGMNAITTNTLAASADLANSSYWRAYQLAAAAAQIGSNPLTAKDDLTAISTIDNAEQGLLIPATDGPLSIRSKALNLLGLTYLLESTLHTKAQDVIAAQGKAIAAFRLAVYLDNQNADAKNNLELMLETTKAEAKPQQQNQTDANHRKQPPKRPHQQQKTAKGSHSNQHFHGGY